MKESESRELACDGRIYGVMADRSLRVRLRFRCVEPTDAIEAIVSFSNKNNDF